MRITTLCRQLGLCALVALATVSCGGSSGDETDDTTHPATEEGLADAAKEISLLLFDDPSEGYELLSEACRADVTRTEWQTTIEFASEFFEGFYGFPVADVDIGEVEVRNVTETSGEASVESISPEGESITGAGDEWESYVYEDGTWKLAECETLGGD